MPPRLKWLGRKPRVFLASAGALLACTLAPHASRAQLPQTPVFIRSLGTQGRLGTLNAPLGLAHVSTESGEVVYVVDAGDARVQVLSASGQVIGAFGDRGDSPDGFWAPTDVAASPDGEFVYVVDRRHRLVQQFRPTPTCLAGRGRCYVNAWGGWGTGPGAFFEPTGVAVDARGFVYVADWGAHNVQVFDPNGTPIRTVGSVGTARGQLMHPTDVAISPDGDLWVADRDNDRISVFDAEGKFVTVYTFGDRLHYPVGLDFASDGSFAVADYECGYGQGRIRLFSPDRKMVLEKVLGGDGRRDDFPLMGVAKLQDGQVMTTVASGPQSGMAVLTPEGDVSWWGERGRALDQFVFPWGVAVDPLFLAVVDSGNDRVLVFEGPNGDRVLSVLGGELSPQFDFSDPRGLAVWREGPDLDDAVILVADPDRNMVYRGTPTGRRLDSWGSGEAGDEPDAFRQPLDVAVGPDGVAYVADTGNDRIVRRAPDGEVLGTIGPFDSGPVQLAHPSAVTVGPDGLVYVLEMGRSRLQAFTPTGELVALWPDTEIRDVDVGHLWLPVDLACDGDHLYVLENECIQQGSSDHVRVQAFDPKPGTPLDQSVVSVFANYQGAGDGELWNPRGIAAMNGWVAAADSGNNRVELFRWMDEGIAPPPVLPTDTPAPTATPTDEPLTPTPTATQVPPTATATDIPATPTSAPTKAWTATAPSPTTDPAEPSAVPSNCPTLDPTSPTSPPSPSASDATATLATPYAERQPHNSRRVNYLPLASR